MKKIYISGAFNYIDDSFTYKLKQDLTEMEYEVVNKDMSSQFYDDTKTTTEYLISQSDIFIAIIRDKNSFVFYELGYATALGKKVLIVAESEFDLPISLKKYNYIKFDNGISNSIYSIINFLQKTDIEETAIHGNVTNFKELVNSVRENPQIIDRISGPEFENFIFTYFQNAGASISKPSSSSDYGYDFIISDWKGSHKTIVEVKKYNKNSKVSVNTIQQIVGAMNIYEADHGIIITTSEFTSSAKEFANSLNKEIELWDINYLLQNI